MRILPISLLALALLTGWIGRADRAEASDGPWTAGQGRGSVTLTAMQTRLKYVHDYKRDRADINDTNVFNYSMLLEYGLHDRVDLTLSVPWEIAYRGEHGDTDPFPQETVRGFADAEAGLKFQFHRANRWLPLDLSIATSVKAPLRNYPTGAPSAPGENQVDWTMRLDAGKTWDTGRFLFYASGYIGYRVKFDDPDDELIGGGAIGAFLTPKLSVNLFADFQDRKGGVGLLSDTFFERSAEAGVWVFPEVEQDYLKGGVGVGYQFTERIGAYAFYRQSLYAYNTSVDRSWGLSLSYSF